MTRHEIWDLIVAVGDKVHTALWALLAAFLIFFVVFVLPNVPEMITQAQINRAKEIAAENEEYCAKFGMGSGSQKHDQCLLDLGEFRYKVEKRIADESDSVPF